MLLGRPLPDIFISTVFRPRHIWDNISYFLGRRSWLIGVLVAGIATGVSGFILLWKRLGWPVLFFLVLAPAMYVLPLLTAWNFRDDIVRFLIPVLPAILTVSVYTFDQALRYYWEKRLKNGPEKTVSS